MSRVGGWWLAAAIVLVSGCRSNHDSASDRALNANFAQEPATLDPTRCVDRTCRALTLLIDDTLVGYDNDLRLIPRIAESWVVEDQGRSVRFKLRAQARWHDGAAVTSRDLIHTWKVFADRSQSSPDRQVEMAHIVDVAPLGEHEIRVTYDHALPSGVELWADKPILQEGRKLDPEHPIGCGPWRFVSWVRGQSLRLERFPEHWATPRLAAIQFHFLKDYSTRYQALQAGDLDIDGMHPDHAAEARADQAFSARYEIQPAQILFYFYVAWRMDGSNPFFSDAAVRQAMTMGLDRQGYIDKLAHGQGRVGITSYHPNSPYFDPQAVAWPYDPAAAAGLLQRAGWVDRDGDGIRERNGVPFRFRLTYTASVESDKIFAFLQQQWRQIGIAADPQRVEWAAYQSARDDRHYQALMSGQYLEPTPDCSDLWHSSQAAHGSNYAGLADQELDRALEAAAIAVDPNARKSLHLAIQHRLHQLEPVTVLFYSFSNYAVSRALAGVKIGPLGPWRSWPGPESWRWTSGKEMFN